MNKIILSAGLVTATLATAQNTGIGTTAPQGKLHVAGNTIIGDYVKGNPGKLILYPTSATEGGEIIINKDPQSGTVDWKIDQIGGNGTGGFYSRFRIFPGSNENRGLSILESGYLGLGVANPQAKLDIAGNIKITDGTQGAGKVLTSDANGLAVWQTPADIPTYTASTSIVLNGSSFQRAALTGDVTAAQNSNVTTIAPNAVTSAKIADGTITTADLSNLGATAAGQNLIWNGTSWVATTPTAANSANIYTTDGALVGNRTVTMGANNIGFIGTGNFGIGTITPQQKLQVAGNTQIGDFSGGNPGSLILDKTSALEGGQISIIRDNTYGTKDWTIDQVGGNNTSHFSRLRIFPGNDENNGIAINENGKVGIGTINPSTKLDIQGKIKIADGSQNTGKVLISDEQGVGTWQYMTYPVPTTGATTLWDASILPDLNTIDGLVKNTIVTYGPYTVPETGWYSMRSRWFYEQNTDITNGGNSDQGSGYVWLQINTDSSNTMDGSGPNPPYEVRFTVNSTGSAVCPPTGALIYLQSGTNYYIHQNTTHTKYPSTGERKFSLIQLK